MQPVRFPLTEPKVVIHKEKRRLLLYSGGKVFKSCQIGLGFNPAGHKTREGDGRTPEGTYYVCCKNPNSRFHLSLGLSYPNERDARRGLRNGLIAKRQYDRIVHAVSTKRTPPWNTPLGGEIFIHGHGSGSDWTHGCIALDNEDIRELYPALPVGTPVTILP